MIRKLFYPVVIALLVTNYTSAQSNLLNATKVEQIGKQSKEKIAADNDSPLAYGYIDDRDILWSKVVWEFVDLNQKINLPYYFPIDTANISNDRRSLFDTLLKGIRRGDLKNVYSDSFFTSKITGSEIDEKLVNIRLNGDYPDTFRIQTQDIEGYMMKGMWYFDKRLGELKYRSLALAPMGKDVLTLGLPDIEDEELYELFWVFYPSARNILHKAKVFNPKNVSEMSDKILKIIIDKVSIYEGHLSTKILNGTLIKLDANIVVKVSNGYLRLDSVRTENCIFDEGKKLGNENRR